MAKHRVPPIAVSLAEAEVDDASVKEDAYAVIQKGVEAFTGRVIDRAAAKLLLEAGLEVLLFGAVRAGYVRLPRGFGSFHLKRARGPIKRKLPDGRTIEIAHPRPGLRYTEGLAIRELLSKHDKYPARLKPRVSAVAEVLEEVAS